MEFPLLTPATTREHLDKLEVNPKKSYGQNFLVDANLVRKSLEMASIQAGEDILEIGPGLGTLTRGLLNSGAKVWAVEKDKVMARHLRGDLLPMASGNLDLLEGDAVDSPRGNLPDGTSYKVVANLPYAITSNWLEGVLDGALPKRMVLLVQKEAAQRLLAQSGSKSIGAISIFLQAAYRESGQHPVSRTCFYPVPEVDSVLLRLDLRDDAFAFSYRQREFVRKIFTMRRKQLGSVCRKLGMDGWFAKLEGSGLPEGVRAESVPLTFWKDIGQD
jgi:16S rRNA (adenine1518-N6/adenine1519-N6)-dimethyltransferase